jgi:protein involved in temperature-dependent protein secretion
MRSTGYLEKAVALNPTGPGTRVELARAFIRQGQYQEAKHQLLLAGHYACLTRRTSILNEATELLSELEKGSL